ncbi:MAG TPA: hypothetical protein PLY35_12410 [Thermotogota bacterium]|nr:hypothetical protein [Thermotogota bacterium]
MKLYQVVAETEGFRDRVFEIHADNEETAINIAKGYYGVIRGYETFYEIRELKSWKCGAEEDDNDIDTVTFEIGN